MRLIDADALKEKLLKERDAIPVTCTERYGFGVEFPNHHGQSMRGGIKKALRCMEETSTIDAVPVVRCKDCDYSRPLNRKDPFEDTFTEGCIWCHEHGDAVFENDFCSCGVRKAVTPNAHSTV